MAIKRPRFLSIKEAWDDYRKNAIKDGTSIDEVARRAVAFYAGAMISSQIYNYAVRGPVAAEEACRILNLLEREIDELVDSARQVIDGHLKKN